MRFDPPLLPAVFLRRYKRFLADVRLLSNGRKYTVHCPNPGSMISCMKESWPALISDSQNPKRKLRYSLEMLHNGRTWIGINTQRANSVVQEAIELGHISELANYSELRCEVPYGDSRLDFLLGKDCYVEVKSVSLKQDGAFRFPDAPSTRGQKHIQLLMELAKAGKRAVLFFIIQRSDARVFAPAAKIDPRYAQLLRLAQQSEVEILAYQARMSKHGIQVKKKIKVDLDFRNTNRRSR